MVVGRFVVVVICLGWGGFGGCELVLVLFGLFRWIIVWVCCFGICVGLCLIVVGFCFGLLVRIVGLNWFDLTCFICFD